MKASVRPILSAVRGRLYSAQAAAQSAENVSLPKQGSKISRLPSGTIVASLENYSPIARIGVLYNAGSRYEDGSNEGVTHALRLSADLATQNCTAFGITRNIQQIGGNLTCSTTREHMIYVLECMRDSVETGVEFLGEAATSPIFKSWEVADRQSQLHVDLALLHEQPQAQLMETLHKVAFRDTLGRGLFTPAHKIGTHTAEMLQQYVSRHFTPSNMAVVGIGVDHDTLTNYAQKHMSQGSSTSEAPSKQAAKYQGGCEQRIENNSPVVHAALVSEGIGLGSKDLMALAILQRVMGTGPYVKYGSSVATSRVTQAAAQGTSNPFAATSINLSYSDSGLFGFCVAGYYQDMGKILKSVVDKFSATTKGGITNEEVQRAKAQLKASVAMDMESSVNLVVELGAEALVTGGIYSMEEINQAIDKVSSTDVQNIAKKVINNKPTMVTIGNLTDTPYLHDLLV